METILQIQGMHCEACKSLIRMEIEEAGLQDVIKELRLKGENEGELVLAGHVTQAQIQELKHRINALPNYSVL